MTEHTDYTERTDRDVVLRERAAFVYGARRAARWIAQGTPANPASLHQYAEGAYPLPESESSPSLPGASS